MDEDDEARGVSSYLTNPVPFSNPTTPSELPVISDLASISDPVQIAKIRASVAELLVFGFHGMSLNDHARKLLSMGASFFFSFPLSILCYKVAASIAIILASSQASTRDVDCFSEELSSIWKNLYKLCVLL